MPVSIHRQQRSNASNYAGFTIIELLIVLAMAGIILALVIGVIPTLQRTSRNDQRRQDVQAILEAVSQYQLNNSGNFPNDCDGDCEQGTNYLRFTKLSNYEFSDVETKVLTADITREFSDIVTLQQVKVHNYNKCKNDATGAAVGKGAGFGDVVAIYAIETRSGHAQKCQQL